MTLIAKEPGTSPAPDSAAPNPPQPPGGGDVPSDNARQVVRLLAALVAITAIFVVAGLGDLLIFIAILIAIVMLHELAHFATAKWSGMQVTEYFVGFGPRLWSVRRGETEYGVKAIPAGGYVKITGFTMLEDVPQEDEPRAYRQQAFWKRIVVASAGSAMHFIIALVLAFIVALAWGVPSNNPSIDKLEHWHGVAQTPAQQAGIRVGDTIVSVNGKTFTDPAGLQTDLKGTAGQNVSLGVLRDGRLIHLTVVPRSGQSLRHLDPSLFNVHSSYIGVGLQFFQSDNALSAVGDAGNFVGSSTKAEVLGIGRLFSASGLSSFYHQVTNSKVAAKEASDPKVNRPVSLVGIASLGVQSQQEGLYNLFELLILINIVFGLLNMLPIIPLDGGHVATAIYEWIRTKKGQPFYRADITKMFPFVAVILAFLLVIVFSAVYLDITHPLQIPH